MFVIKNVAQDIFVKGRKRSMVYVTKIENATKFKTSFEAKDVLDSWSSGGYPTDQFVIVAN